MKNNLVSYYTNMNKNNSDGEIDILRTGVTIAITLTLINMLFALIFIPSTTTLYFNDRFFCAFVVCVLFSTIFILQDYLRRLLSPKMEI